MHKQVDLLSNLQLNVNSLDIKKDRSEPKINNTDKKVKDKELDSVNGSISARSSIVSVLAQEKDKKRKILKKKIYR